MDHLDTASEPGSATRPNSPKHRSSINSSLELPVWPENSGATPGFLVASSLEPAGGGDSGSIPCVPTIGGSAEIVPAGTDDSGPTPIVTVWTGDSGATSFAPVAVPWHPRTIPMMPSGTGDSNPVPIVSPTWTGSSEGTGGIPIAPFDPAKSRPASGMGAEPVAFWDPDRSSNELPDSPDRNVKDDSIFWDQYVKEADLYDKELVKGLGGDLDTLLIFAGLFSAVNTAFIIESYQDLKPDPAESGGTNALLRTLIQTVNNSTVVIAPPADFVPSSRIVIVNALFFASLFCSLFAAFGAVLAKQWLNEYERTGAHRTPYARAHHRHAKYLGMQRYHSEMVMQALGTVLQVSLFLFLIAVANWLWGINHVIAIIAIVGVAMTFIFYLITTAISIYDSSSPFSTRLSALLYELFHSHKSPDILAKAGTDEINKMDGKCIAWVRDNATMFESIVGMARAAAPLPHHIRTELELDHEHVGPVLLHSIISANAISLGLINGTLFSTVNAIREAMTSWRGVPISLACDVIAQLHQTLRLTISKDPSLSEATIITLQRSDLDLSERMEALTMRPEQGLLVDFATMSSLTLEGKRAGLSLLWRYNDFTFSSYSYIPYQGGPMCKCPPHAWSMLQGAARPNLGAPERSWPWRVAEALESTGMWNEESEDRDMERLQLRITWAAALGPDEHQSKRMLYGDTASVSPLWIMYYPRSHFAWYFLRNFQRYPNREDLALHKAVMDFLAYYAPRQVLKAFHEPSDNHPVAEKIVKYGLLEEAFNINAHFKPGYMAALYWWFHIREEHPELCSPTAFVTRQYIQHAIFEFLLEQMDGEPWIPAKHVPWTMDAIRAYINQFNSMDPAQHRPADVKDVRPLWKMHDLMELIRHGSYQYRGEASVGQELWNCFKLVVRSLYPGDGTVTFKTKYWLYTGPRELQIDWEEIDTVRIRGMDSVPYELPPVTGDNFIGFGSY